MKILIRQRNPIQDENGYINFDHIEHIRKSGEYQVKVYLQSGSNRVIYGSYDPKAQEWINWFDREIKRISENHTDGLHILDYKEKQ